MNTIIETFISHNAFTRLKKSIHSKNRFNSPQMRHCRWHTSIRYNYSTIIIVFFCRVCVICHLVWHGILEPLQWKPLFMRKILWLPSRNKSFILLYIKTIISSSHHLPNKLSSFFPSLLHETQLSVKAEREEKTEWCWGKKNMHFAVAFLTK